MILTKQEPSSAIQTKELQYYHALFSSIEDIVISTDNDFVIQTWNAAAEKIYGISASQAIGQKTYEIIAQKFLHSTKNEVFKNIIKNHYWKGITEYRAESGEKLFLQTKVTLVRNAYGKSIGYVSVSRDITDDMKTRQSLQKLKSLLTKLEESFLIVDRNLNIVFLSPKGNVEKFFNSAYQLGDNALKYIPEEYFHTVQHYYDRALNGETINHNAESVDEDLFLEVTYTPLMDTLGNITNVCVIVKDLTYHKQLEKLEENKRLLDIQLFENRQKFEEFMEKSPLLAWITDQNGIMRYMNPPYLKSFEFSKDVIGKSVYELFPENIAKEYEENNLKVIQCGKSIETIEKGRQPGSLHTYKSLKFPISYKGDTMVAGWAVDITDQIEMQENLAKLNAHKDRLLAIISHDLRGPLGINSNFLKLIIEDFDLFEKEEILHSLTSLKNSIRRSYELTDEMLTWGKTQINKVNYNPVKIQVGEELSSVINSLEDQLSTKQIMIQANLSNTYYGYADADLFSIVARNIISNAIKFSHCQSSIHIQCSIVKDFVHVSIQDFGTGIKPELIEKIMQSTNYESTFGTSGEPGTGLGMLISKDYIQKNGGTLQINSVEGNGSTFIFTIPLYTAAA